MLLKALSCLTPHRLKYTKAPPGGPNSWRDGQQPHTNPWDRYNKTDTFHTADLPLQDHGEHTQAKLT